MRTLEVWCGDGIIADLDNPDIEEATKNINVPLVGIGGSYARHDDYPNVPYIATDNKAIADTAYVHLRGKGLERFAYYGLPKSRYHRWRTNEKMPFESWFNLMDILFPYIVVTKPVQIVGTSLWMNLQHGLKA